MDPTAQKRQRQGKRLFWFLASLAVLLPLGWLLYLTFGPNPPIVVSKATTHITTPLAADGLPDYAAALLAKMKKGVTPENNGAVLFMQVMWPDEGDYEAISADDAKLICKEVGIASPPATELRISDYWNRDMRLAALRHYRARVPKPQAADSPDIETFEVENQFLGYDMNDAYFWEAPESEAIDDMRVENLLDAAMGRPWTAEDLPFAAVWLDANEVGFELLLEGLEKPQWYLPRLEWLRGGRGEMLSGTSMHDLQMLRQATRYLQIRANRSHGDGRYEDAAREVIAICRLAKHSGTQPYSIDQLFAMAIEGIGLEAVNRLASDPNLPAESVRSMSQKLAATGTARDLQRAFNYGERWLALDTITAMALNQYSTETAFEQSPLIMKTRLDWNPVLIHANQYFDDVLQAGALPTWQARQSALEAIEVRITSDESAQFSIDTARRFLTTDGRSDLAAKMFNGLLMSAFESMFAAEDRVLINHSLTRLHLASAIHRAEQGSYPESLDVLVPDIFAELPTDHFNNKPSVYRRTDDGFLLYSLGPNGRDDGGSNEGYEGGSTGPQKYEGVKINEMLDPTTDTLTPEEQAAYDLIEKIPAGADDLSLRVPLPVEPWPWEE